MSHTLKVDLGVRSYPIHIGRSLLQDPTLITPHLLGNQVMIVTNETIAPLYLDQVRHTFAGFTVAEVILPDGEVYKDLATWHRIFDALLQHRFDRKSTLVALGGGVIGDITGYAAASYQRGVPFIQIPTTLLAQVDSSVGGKTGINHPQGKNMIGAFHQPRCVIADTDTLNTLEDRQLSAGMAEVIKYGLIRDAELFVWLEQNMESLMARDPDALAYAIRRSCENKAEVVAADELEAGQRALLNSGHTFGHAIEAGMGYGTWLHGEAVAAGMVMACDLSCREGWLDPADLGRLQALLQQARLPITGPDELSPERYLELMAVDKKVESGRIRLVLQRGIGQAFLCDHFSSQRLRQTLEECQ